MTLQSTPGRRKVKNDVLNFCLKRFGRTDLPAGISTAEIDVSVSAEDAARLAETGDYEVLVVEDQGNVVGLFFPEYLKEILPGHGLVRNAIRQSGADTSALDEMIERIDEAGIEFHSEIVNISPNVWICRGGGGHITYVNPCSKHNLQGEPF